MPEHGYPMDALQAAVAALGMFYPGRNVKDVENNYWSGGTADRQTAHDRGRLGSVAARRRIHSPRDDLAFSDNFLHADGKCSHPLWSEVFDDCLILHAEHTMNASTFAGMVTASTLADPYTVVASSIGA